METGQRESQGITYRQAGVDIEAGNRVVELIRPHVARTRRPEVLKGIGSFGGFFALEPNKFRRPVLVAGADGVGTKLKVAFQAGRHNTVGIDCVAMCVNDILVQGAEPLFFLDYLAVCKLVPEQAAEVIRGIAEGCRQAGCALLGGETAELPGLYQEGEYDLAGFAVGAVEQDRIVDGSGVREGDSLIGLASSGLHSNGYSLVRRVLMDKCGYGLDRHLDELGCCLEEELLRPTRIYVPAVLPLLDRFSVRGMAHITGGGIVENLPRALPQGLGAEIRLGSWAIPAIFDLVAREGPVAEEEMWRTFNLGLGLILVVPPSEEEDVLGFMEETGERAYSIGRVVADPGGVRLVRV